jgi:hypothetical protein
MNFAFFKWELEGEWVECEDLMPKLGQWKAKRCASLVHLEFLLAADWLGTSIQFGRPKWKARGGRRMNG